MDDYAKSEVHIREKPVGLLWETEEQDISTRIWVKTWSRILHDCRTRLKFFHEALKYSANKDASLDYLKRTYARILQGTDISDPPEVDDADNGDGVETKVVESPPAKPAAKLR